MHWAIETALITFGLACSCAASVATAVCVLYLTILRWLIDCALPVCVGRRKVAYTCY